MRLHTELERERKANVKLKEKLKEVAENTAHDCFEVENNGTDIMPYIEHIPTGRDCYRCELETLLGDSEGNV